MTAALMHRGFVHYQRETKKYMITALVTGNDHTSAF